MIEYELDMSVWDNDSIAMFLIGTSLRGSQQAVVTSGGGGRMIQVWNSPKTCIQSPVLMVWQTRTGQPSCVALVSNAPL